MSARIFIVEDDQNIGEIEAFALKNSGYQTEVFSNGTGFLKRLEEELPDLVLLDVMLPDMSGLDILSRLRSDGATRSLPVMMITAKTTEIDKVRGLDLGADDYMTKPFGVMEMISRVKAMLRRVGAPKEHKPLSCQGIVVDEERHLVLSEDLPVELTYKEYELLKLLLSNAGSVLRRSRLLEEVWGTDFEGESRTLDMHIKTLRQKLGEKGSLIKTVRNVGYTLDDRP